MDSPALLPPRITPPPKPLSGLAFITTFVRNPIEVVPRAAYEEDFVPVARGRRIWITSPALIKAVLLDERDKFCKRTQIRLLGPLLGRGILTSEGAQWRWQRQAASPMFRPQELAACVPAFVRAAEDCAARWLREPDGSVHRVDTDMTRTTFEVIAGTLLRSSDESLAPTIRRSVDALAQAAGWDLLYASLDLPAWLPHPGMISSVRAMRSLRARVAAVLRERRAADAEAADLTQRLIAARDPETGATMGDERLVDNVLTFYLAGHETTAKALTWTLFLLARYPQWSAALEGEIERVVGNGAVTAGHVEKLVLTQQVIQEAMRLYPPVPIMSRQALADVRIDGREVAAGTSLLMPIYAIHRHARRWKDPDAFVPERFAPGNESSIARYQYMPFGAGPRICIGRAFAAMESAAILATLLQRVRLGPVEGADPVPVARVTLLPRGGLTLRVTRR